MAFEEVKAGEFVNLEVGESLEGVYITSREGQFGDVWDIETKDGIKTLPSKTILASRMKLVKSGDKIRVTRSEDIKTGTGRIAQNFKVEVDK